MSNSVSFIDPSVATAGELRAPASELREIAFIDPGVDAIETLLGGLRPEIEAVVLNAVEAAPRQMARVLSGREGLEAIHVIAHGAPGQVRFAAGTLSAHTLHNYANALAYIRTSVGAGTAKMALWSCNTGAGEAGVEFIGALAEATGLEVAASARLVGAAARGGDWELDARTRSPLTVRGIEDYQHVMTVTLDLNGTGSGNNGSTNFTEQTPVLLFPSATISTSGLDNNSVDRITLTISGAAATESLSLNSAAQSAATSAGITVTYSNGVLTLQGSNEQTSVWQTILQGIQYNNTSDNPTGPRSISVVASNTGTAGDSDTRTDTVNVTAVNDAPVLTDTALTMTTINEDAGAPSGAVGTLVSSLVGGISDPDGAGAVKGIAITAADTANGTWFYSTNNGTTWAAVGAVSDTSALLLASNATTRIHFQPAANYNGTVAAGLTIRAWDTTSGTTGTKVNTATNGGTTAFSTATDAVAITVNAVNDAPVASGSATLAAIAEDAAAPAGATAASLFGGNFSDTTDQVTGGSSANTLAGIAISAYTVDSTKGNWQYSTNGGASWTNLSSASATSAITLNASDLLRFMPVANYNGAATALSANLIESGQTITSGATINLTGATGGSSHISTTAVALSETINAVNDLAVLSSDTRQLTETNAATDISASGTLTISDVDSPATFVAQSDVAGQYGQFSIDASGNWSYVASSAHDEFAAGQTYTDTFAITSADGTATSVTINILGTNDAAVFAGLDAGAVAEAGVEPGLAVASGTLTVTDVDSPATFIAQADAPTAYGHFSIGTDGAWTYTLNDANPVVQALNDGATLHDIITVAAADGTTHAINIAINGSNDAAVIAGGDTGSVTEAGGIANGTPGTPVATGKLSVTDIDNSPTFAVQSDAPTTYGHFSITADGAWTYTLDDANLAVQALTQGAPLHDIATVFSADGTTHAVDITITGSNDAPVISAASDLAVTIVKNAEPISGHIVATDVDNAVLTYGGNKIGNFGSLLVNPDTGVWTYTLDERAQTLAEGQTGVDTFEVTVEDASGAIDSETVTVTVTGANDAPQIGVDSVLDGSVTADATLTVSGQITATDPNDDALTFGIGDTAAGSEKGEFGTLAVDPATGAWTYMLDNELAQGLGQDQPAFESFQVVVADGHGGKANATVTIFVNGVNDPATISGAATGAVTEDTAPTTSGTLSVADLDTGEAAFQPPLPESLVGAYGDFTFDPDSGVWSYALDPVRSDSLKASEEALDTLTVISFDGTASQTIDITITGSNDAAKISGSAAGSVVEDGTTVAIGNLTVADPDTGEAVFQSPASLAGTYGNFAFNPATGVWGYALDAAKADPLAAGQVVHDTLTVTSFDGTASQVIDVTITGSNGVAVISGSATGAVVEDVTTSAAGALSVTDADAGEATFQAPASLAGSYGDFTFDPANGAWSYALDAAKADPLAAGQVVHDTLTVTSFDGTASQVIDVTITGSNDAATIAGDSTGALTEDDVASAAGALSVTDVDAGEAAFRMPASLAGSYGAFTFDPVSGAWSYVLDPVKANTLTAGQEVHETLTVTSLDGSASRTIDVTVTGANDPATIGGTATGAVIEGVATSATDTLSVADPDTGEAIFRMPVSLAGVYGNFAFNPATGVWGYALDAAKADPLAAGQVVHDTLTVTSFDGTASQVIDVTITGSNGVAVISGSATGAVVEDVTTSAAGALSVTDADAGEATFQAPASLAGSYGDFTFDPANGAWSYALDAAKADPLAAGQVVHDTLTVTSFDGTASQVIDVTITGSNDAATIAGDSTGALTEDDVASAAGALSVTDVDAGEAAFRMPASLAGSYGAFTFDPVSGAWSYVLDPVKANTLTAGQEVHETLTVTSLDGSASRTIDVTVTGANDPATIGGTATGAVIEGVATSATDTLSVADPDTGEAIFRMPVSLAGVYGNFAFNPATGVWGYALDAAKADPLAAGQVVHDTLTVTSFDGTASQVIDVTITGSNGVAVISGSATGAVVEDVTTSAAGALSVTDADAGEATFQAPASLAGSYGDFTFDPANGAWSYALDAAKADPLAAGQVVHDTLTVTSFDGTASQVIDVTITGSNDAATIAGDSTGALTEDDVASAAGALSVTDVDAGEAAFRMPASLAGSYGAFTFDPVSGAWSYVLDPVKANTLTAGQEVHETLTVTSLDGSASRTIDVTVTGANDPATIGGTATGAVIEGVATSATDTLSVADPDTGEAIFRMPVSLAGVYGNFAFNPATGVWGYALDAAKADPLAAGQVVHDTLTVTSFDGTASQVIDVTITGSNGVAVISGSATGAVVEDVTTSAAGALSVTDADAGEATFQAPASLAGSYGDFTFDPANGAWSYALDAAKADPLAAGQVVHDTLTVTSFDGTASQVIDVTITGSNDAATIAGDSTGALTEDDVASAAGALSVTDVDAGEAAFRMPASLAGSYGAFTFDPVSGAWSYVLDPVKANTLTAGQEVHETLTVTSLDGSASRTIDVTVTGANDPATIGGTATGAVIEGVATSATDTLSVADPDTGEAIFRMPVSLAGVYGNFAFNPATGVWGYALDAAKADPLAAGQVVHDTLTVTSFDGTASQVIDVTITGSNGVAVISGSATGAVVEDVTTSAAGALSVTDADAGEATFQAPASLAGSYGDFTFDPANGAWSYALDAAKADPLAAGQVVHDTLTVTSFDGTASQVIDVTITGSNDAATIAGDSTGALTEDDVASAAGALSVTDVDAGEAAFRMPASLAGSYGAFTFDPVSGAWSYVLDPVKANTLTAGQEVHETLTVTSLDGSASRTIDVTVTGANDPATIGGTATGAVIEGVATSATDTLSVADPDTGEAIFRMPVSLAGVYGNFAFNPATGVWGYALDAAKADPLAAGQVVHDTLTVTSFDGTASQVIDVTITGSNGVAVISGSATGAVVEDVTTSAAGALSVTDADAGEATFQAPASLAGSYGDFTFDPANGAWSYALDAAKADPLAAGQVVHDTLTVTSFDGTASQVIDVTITGSNDLAAISGTATGAVAMDAATSAGGALSVTDPDTGEAAFQAPAPSALTGSYGSFAFNPGTGVWSYVLDPAKASGLVSGQVVHDTLTVASIDGTANQVIDVTVSGRQAPLVPSTPDLLAGSDRGASNTDNITNVVQPTFTGTAEAGATVILYDGSTVIGTGVATGGTWSITAASLANGNHSITAKAANSAGNLSDASAPLTVTIDSLAPTAPSAPDMLAASDTGTSSSDNITTVTTPIFAGTAEVGSTVTLFDGSTAVGSGVADANGVWSIMASPLAVGAHSMTAKASDVAGNVSVASSGLAVTIVSTIAAPSTPDLVTASDTGAASTDNITKTVRPDFTGTATAGSKVTLYDGTTVIGTATANATTSKWTITSTKLADGVHSITATATDKSGNISGASPALLVTIDTVAPVAPSAPDLTTTSDTGASSTDNITGVKTPTFTGAAEAGATVAIYNGTTKVGLAVAGADGAWTITTSAMGNGVHVMTTKATDAAGNISVASGALSITIDATPPTAPKALDLITASDTGVSTTDNITKVNTPTIAGTAEAGSTVTLYDGATLIGTGVTTAAGTWNITASSLTDGKHSITAKAMDAMGNVSAASNALSVTIDTVAPNAPVVTGGTTSTLTGTGEAGATITILNGATVLGTTTVGSGGKWNWSFTAGSSVRTLTAAATDKAGNASAVSSGSALIGTGGANTLTSTAGNDILVGRGGADTFSFGSAFGVDVIADFAATGAAHDIINFHSNPTLSSFAQVLSHATQVGSGVMISDGSNTLMLNNVVKSSLTAADFTFI